MSSGTTADQLTGPVGFSLPLSPSGTSAMLTAPPWHFSGEIVLVDYRVDPAAARRFLPPELDLRPDPVPRPPCSRNGSGARSPVRS